MLCFRLWDQVGPVVGFEPPPVVVEQLLVAYVAGPVAAEPCVGTAGVELVFVLDAAERGLEQGLSLDLQFEPSDDGTGGDGLFQVVVLPLVVFAEKALDDDRGDDRAEQDADARQDELLGVHAVLTPGMSMWITGPMALSFGL